MNLVVLNVGESQMTKIYHTCKICNNQTPDTIPRTDLDTIFGKDKNSYCDSCHKKELDYLEKKCKVCGASYRRCCC